LVLGIVGLDHGLAVVVGTVLAGLVVAGELEAVVAGALVTGELAAVVAGAVVAGELVAVVAGAVVAGVEVAFPVVGATVVEASLLHSSKSGNTGPLRVSQVDSFLVKKSQTWLRES